MFRQLGCLRYVDLSYNKIDRIYKFTFIGQTILQTLLLSHNSITVIEPQGFLRLHALEPLFLTYNNIGVVDPVTFQFTPSLFLLNTSYNNLTCLPNVQNLKNLYVIDARHNQIDRLDSNSFIGLDNLAGLNILGNKLC